MQHKSLDSLKVFILREWDRLPLKIIYDTIRQLCKRLFLVIHKDGVDSNKITLS